MAYKNIALVGATGQVGPHVLNALVAANKFNVTVIARHSSTSSVSAPSSVRVLKVDFESHQALVEALRGQEALVLTYGDFGNLDKNTKVLVEAAIEAGVQRVIPSEYGVDLSTEPGKSFSIFAPKVRAAEYLEEKAKENKITYSLLATGAFFDWGLQVGFLGFDLKGKKVALFDDGETLFNSTNIASIGEAIVGILSKPEATANKALRIHDFFVSQNAVLKVLEAELGKFEVSSISTKALAEKSAAGLARGEFTDENIYGLVKVSAFGQPSASAWGTQDDSELLGVSRKNLEVVLKEVAKPFKA